MAEESQRPIETPPALLEWARNPGDRPPPDIDPRYDVGFQRYLIGYVTWCRRFGALSTRTPTSFPLDLE